MQLVAALDLNLISKQFHCIWLYLKEQKLWKVCIVIFIEFILLCRETTNAKTHTILLRGDHGDSVMQPREVSQKRINGCSLLQSQSPCEARVRGKERRGNFSPPKLRVVLFHVGHEVKLQQQSQKMS